jgi:hypothetical protein
MFASTFDLKTVWLTAAVSRKVMTLFSGSSLTNFTGSEDYFHTLRQVQHTSMMYFKTAGMTPAAPFVGDVTMRPPAALTSLTAIA